MRPGLIFRECNPGTSNIKPAVMNSWRVDYECFSSTGQSAAFLKQSRRRTPPAQPRRPTRPVSAHFEIATFDVCSGTSSDRGQHLDAAIKNYPSPFPNLHPDRDLWPGRSGDRKIKGTRGEKKKTHRAIAPADIHAISCRRCSRQKTPASPESLIYVG